MKKVVNNQVSRWMLWNNTTPTQPQQTCGVGLESGVDLEQSMWWKVQKWLKKAVCWEWWHERHEWQKWQELIRGWVLGEGAMEPGAIKKLVGLSVRLDEVIAVGFEGKSRLERYRSFVRHNRKAIRLATQIVSRRATNSSTSGVLQDVGKKEWCVDFNHLVVNQWGQLPVSFDREGVWISLRASEALLEMLSGNSEEVHGVKQSGKSPLMFHSKKRESYVVVVGKWSCEALVVDAANLKVEGNRVMIEVPRLLAGEPVGCWEVSY